MEGTPRLQLEASDLPSCLLVGFILSRQNESEADLCLNRLQDDVFALMIRANATMIGANELAIFGRVVHIAGNCSTSQCLTDNLTICARPMGADFPAIPSIPSKKTETVSYRIRSELRSALEEEARRLGINPNALVSQIFSRHISWGRYVGRLNFIPVSKDFLRLVFESLPREDTEKIATSLGESAAHEELLFLFQHISPGTILMFIDLWASHFEAWDHQYEGGKHFVTVKHDVNLNFSQFTKAYVSSLLQSTLGTTVTFEAMTPNSVTFTFESPLNHWRNNNGKTRIDRTNGRPVELQKKAV